MQKMTNDLTATLKPFLILAAYRDEAPGYKFYFESHAIGKKGEVLAGQPLNHETVDQILRSFEDTKRKEKRVPAGRIPQNLLYANNTSEEYVWTLPSQKRFLYFKNEYIGNGEAYVPELLFAAKGKGLSVFAIKRTRKGPKLCHAPFPNMYENGSVCLGTAAAKKDYSTFQSVLDYWDKIFFGSEFTHLNNQTSLAKVNINVMWKEAIASGKPFSNAVLIETKNELEDLLK